MIGLFVLCLFTFGCNLVAWLILRLARERDRLEEQAQRDARVARRTMGYKGFGQ